jgi:two-component system NtrC family sensor kinase
MIEKKFRVPDYSFHTRTFPMLSHPTVLIVDNEVDLVELLQIEIAGAGYDVLTAFDGEEALRRLKQREVELIVLDLNMPRMNGFEVLRRMKEEYPRTKSIVLTGYGDVQTAIRCKKMGADTFLSKPYSLLELLLEMERLLAPAQV